jgi:LmbE family N-acetylglucosaminyl deacetylase
VISGHTPLLVVSPHLDDAVLSAFALLQRRDVTVLTVFSGLPGDRRASDWDVLLGQDDGLDSMHTRVAEDTKVLEHLGVAARRLPLLDAGYRRGPIDEDDLELLRVAVDEWCAATDGIVVLPACAGARDTRLYRARWNTSWPLLRVPGGGLPHVDHLATRDVLLPVLLRHRRPMAFYEDLPYLWTGRGDRRVAEVRRRTGIRTRRFHLPVDVAAKTNAIEMYASQTPELFRPWVERIGSVIPPRERYWLVRP